MLGKARSVAVMFLLAGAIVVPGSASAVGDATYSLASYRAMAERAAMSPSERVMAVYMDSAERFEMLKRLQERYPVLVR